MGLFDHLRDQLNRITYRTLYTVAPQSPPWEYYKPHPPLVDLLARAALPAGPVLDAGCGLGTQSIYLAKQGFEVEGVDFQPHAVAQAKRNAADAGVRCRFDLLDVTAPSQRGPYALILDRGCWHSLSDAALTRYANNLARWLAPGGSLLLSCFVWETPLEWLLPSVTPRVSAAQVTALLVGELVLVERRQTMPGRLGQPKMVTYRFEKR